nr:MAK10-like protein [Tanacetum cinerariifolium]
MEAHLTPTQPTQVNKVNTSCEIYSGLHDTQNCMEDPEQAFVEYASSRIDEARDARLSKFEADFKQQQSEMTNKINTVLKAITNRIAGALPSDKKNPKLSTSLVLSHRYYPTIDPQCSSHPSTSINYIKAHSKEANISQTSLPRTYARKDFLDCHLPIEWEIARDVELNPFKDTLVFRRIVKYLGAIHINLKSNMWESEDLIKNLINWDKPPKNGDGAWHVKIIPIDPDGEEFTKTLQSIPTTRKVSKRETPRDIIDLDHFYFT